MLRNVVIATVCGAVLGAGAAWAGSLGYEKYAEAQQKVEFACSKRVCRV